MTVNGDSGLKVSRIRGTFGTLLGCLGIIVLVVAVIAGALLLSGNIFSLQRGTERRTE